MEFDPSIVQQGKHFCVLPWIHTHIQPSGKVFPCCVFDYNEPFDRLGDQSLLEVINGAKFKAMRRSLIKDESVGGCRVCYNNEVAGAKSLRNEMNQNYGPYVEAILASTREDGSLSDFKMMHLDIRFSNVCNFKCRGCSVELSSAWKQEVDSLYISEHPQDPIIRFGVEKIWPELLGMAPYIEGAYFAGGEPLLMQEHYDLLGEFIRIGKTNISLSYNTNLSVLGLGDIPVTEVWKSFTKVYIGVSIDDLGARGEYFRKGMSWDKTLTHLAQVQRECPHVRIGINCTLSVFNVLYLPELHKALVDHGLISLAGINVNFLYGPDHYCAQILPLPAKMHIQKKYRDYLKVVFAQNSANEEFEALQNSFDAVLKFLFLRDKTQLIPVFKEQTKRLDVIREESFAQVYPELNGWLNKL